jgi:hypothetical protein
MNLWKRMRTMKCVCGKCGMASGDIRLVSGD